LAPTHQQSQASSISRYLTFNFLLVDFTIARHHGECIEKLIVEKIMRLIHRLSSAVAFSALALAATAGTAANAGPSAHGSHTYCLSYDEGGTDCGFTSYAQCKATASGIAAECYASPGRSGASNEDSSLNSRAQASTARNPYRYPEDN
jgi:hypothetical protein